MRAKTIALAALVAASAMLGGCYSGSARNVSPAQLRADGGWVMVSAVPDVRQQALHDCGPAALAMVLQRWGLSDASLAKLKEALPRGPDDTGVAAGALRDQARQRGLRAFLINGSFDDLIHEITEGRPVIVGLVQRYGKKGLSHYEVVVGYNVVTRRLLLHDPGHGPREDNFDGFGAEWKPTGNLTLVVTGWATPVVAAGANGT